MEANYHYATVTEAISQLRKKGFTTDFNLKQNEPAAGENNLALGEFEIMDVYRYEGESDPADEAAVYAIVSSSGVKGILVTGYGLNSDGASSETLKNIHY